MGTSALTGAIVLGTRSVDLLERMLAHRLFASALIFLSVLALTGCPPRPTASREIPPPAVIPAYRQVVERYNANAAQVAQLWARAVVELHWRQDGHDHFEQGDDCHLMVVMPDRASLSIGKAGITLLWAGADASRYWLFDLRSDDNRAAYLGHRGVPPNTEGNGLPVPIYPPDLIRILGIGTIDPAAAPPDPAVEWVDGGFLIEPPGTSTRMLLDPTTYLPRRIDLVDGHGGSRLVAVLSNPQPVAIKGRPPGGLPQVAAHIELTIPGRDARMTLFLSALSDGKDRIDAAVFDFDRLMRMTKAQKPPIDLDSHASTAPK